MSKNYFKKTLAGIFAVALVASSIPLAPYTKVLDSISITASAAVAPAEDFVIDDDGTIKQYNGAGGDVEIPSTIGGVPVTGIGINAFYDCSDLTSITIPEGVTSIGNGAFDSCTSLTSVTIPESVTSIGEDAFKACFSLKNVKISNGLTSIGNYAFAWCEALTSITIPESVKSIGGYAFNGCKALTSIILPKSLESIDAFAFYECSSLKNVYYTGSQDDWKSVSIGSANNPLKNAALSFVTAPKKIFDSELTWILDDNGVMTIIGNDTVFPDCVDGFGEIHVWCDEIDKVTKIAFETPNLTTIGVAAFINFTALENVEIPDTVETIGHRAFQNCKKLDTVTIPSSVTSIGIRSFDGCASLKSISIPESVTSIGDYAFTNCSLLASVKMGVNIESIGANAFNGCAKLESIEIPDKVTSIGAYAFKGCSALTSTSVKFGKGIKSLGAHAFEGCIGLTSVTIPDSVTNIGAQVFRDCTGLTSITFGNSVTSLEMGVLYNCPSLTSITFNGDMPNDINVNAFFNIGTDTAPATLYYPNGNSSWEEFLGANAENIDTNGVLNWNGGYFKAQTIPTTEAKGYSVSYDGDVTINFHYLVTDDHKNGYVKFSDGTKVKVSAASPDKNGYYEFPISMPAKNMYDEITAQFYDANDVAVGDAVTFDLVTYMDKVKAYDSNYSDFVDSFLEYGACAAEYFGNTNSPASTKTYDYASIISGLKADGYDVLPDMGGNYVGATMLLKSTPILRLYYKEEVNGLDLGDNEKWDTNEMNQDLTFIQKEISATNFDTTLFNGYSVYHYLYKALEAGDDEKLMKLCAALYEFSKAADAISE